MTDRLSLASEWLVVLAATVGGVGWGTVLGGYVQLGRIPLSALAWFASRQLVAEIWSASTLGPIPTQLIQALVTLAVWLALDAGLGVVAWRLGWALRQARAKRQYIPGVSPMLPRARLSWRERLAGGGLGALRWAVIGGLLLVWEPGIRLVLSSSATAPAQEASFAVVAGLRRAVVPLAWPEVQDLERAITILRDPRTRLDAFARSSFPCLEENPQVVALTESQGVDQALRVGDVLGLALDPGVRGLWARQECRTDLLTLGAASAPAPP